MRVFIFLTTIAVLSLLAVGLLVFDGAGVSDNEPVHAMNAALVRTLLLTDLALWSEARYTRHPSQADFFTPFQSGPSTLERFPSGSWISPPPRFEPVPKAASEIRQTGERQ